MFKSISVIFISFILAVLAEAAPKAEKCQSFFTPRVSSVQGCSFCDWQVVHEGRLAHAFPMAKNSYNFFTEIVLDQSEHFTLKVTRGAFVPSYFLIISKIHYTRMADFPPTVMADFMKFKARVEKYYAEALGAKVTVFEHGPMPNTTVANVDTCDVEGGGSCIDHFHIHLLPFDKDLLPTIAEVMAGRFDAPIKVQSVAQLAEWPLLKNKSYIFYQNPDGKAFVLPVKHAIPSQLMRTLIADELNILDEANWREFSENGDFLQNTLSSIAAYQRWRLDGPAARRYIEQRGLNIRFSGIGPSEPFGFLAEISGRNGQPQPRAPLSELVQRSLLQNGSRSVEAEVQEVVDAFERLHAPRSDRR